MEVIIHGKFRAVTAGGSVHASLTSKFVSLPVAFSSVT